MGKVEYYRQSKKLIKKPFIFIPSDYYQGNDMHWIRYLGLIDIDSSKDIYQISAFRIPLLNICFSYGEIKKVEVDTCGGWC